MRKFARKRSLSTSGEITVSEETDHIASDKVGHPPPDTNDQTAVNAAANGREK